MTYDEWGRSVASKYGVIALAFHTTAPKYSAVSLAFSQLATLFRAMPGTTGADAVLSGSSTFLVTN